MITVADLTTWDFWGIQWWSALFIVVGSIGLAVGCCDDCCYKEGKPMSKKK